MCIHSDITFVGSEYFSAIGCSLLDEFAGAEGSRWQTGHDWVTSDCPRAFRRETHICWSKPSRLKDWSVNQACVGWSSDAAWKHQLYICPVLKCVFLSISELFKALSKMQNRRTNCEFELRKRNWKYCSNTHVICEYYHTKIILLWMYVLMDSLSHLNVGFYFQSALVLIVYLVCTPASDGHI